MTAEKNRFFLPKTMQYILVIPLLHQFGLIFNVFRLENIQIISVFNTL